MTEQESFTELSPESKLQVYLQSILSIYYPNNNHQSIIKDKIIDLLEEIDER